MDNHCIIKKTHQNTSNICFAIYSANYSKRNALCQLRIVFCLLTVPKGLARGCKPKVLAWACELLAKYLPKAFQKYVFIYFRPVLSLVFLSPQFERTERIFFASMSLRHHLLAVADVDAFGGRGCRAT